MGWKKPFINPQSHSDQQRKPRRIRTIFLRVSVCSERGFEELLQRHRRSLRVPNQQSPKHRKWGKGRNTVHSADWGSSAQGETVPSYADAEEGKPNWDFGAAPTFDAITAFKDHQIKGRSDCNNKQGKLNNEIISWRFLPKNIIIIERIR